MSAANPLHAPPLCVALDHTLIRSSSALEGLLRLLKTNILLAPLALLWLLRGRAYFRSQVAQRVRLDPANLPYNHELLEWLRAERASGRRVYLCTGAHETVATDVAAHLQIFDGVLGSNESVHLEGARKTKLLEERFGTSFDYLGNEGVATRGVDAARVRPARRSRLKSWIRALRIYQWAKNVLIFVPALVSHRIVELPVLQEAIVAFLCFGICASGNYLINDLLDLEADRAHARKRTRPFASGELSLGQGMLAAPLLLLLGIGTALVTLGPMFVGVLLLYLVGTFWYSWHLKRVAMVDVLTLAGLYTVRVIAGGAAIDVAPSFWLLAFSMFMFLSLALVKRYTELHSALGQGKSAASGRGYTTDDLTLLLSCGTSSAFISVMVLALYVNEGSETLYRYPQALWLLCPLMLYWVCRVWLKTYRGELHDDPVVFALRDRPSLLVVCLCGALVVAAT
jgi:4-hydroxybenzoate polyprenyltransferase